MMENLQTQVAFCPEVEDKFSAFTVGLLTGLSFNSSTFPSNTEGNGTDFLTERAQGLSFQTNGFSQQTNSHISLTIPT